MATSATGGYLTTSPPLQPRDADLEDIFQGTFSGITGIPPSLVRPAWQSTVPNQPEFDVNWMAFRVSEDDAEQFPHLQHRPVGDGVTDLTRDEFYEILTSFYGPGCGQAMSALRDGIMLDQNRRDLGAHGIKLLSVGKPVKLPALLKDQWVKRIDLRLRFARRVIKTYQINTVQEATVQLDAEDSTSRRLTIIVNQTP